MNATETQSAKSSRGDIRLFASHSDQEAETLKYWSSRTINERLQALAEILRAPMPLTLNPEEKYAEPYGRVARIFKDREEQEIWNRQRVSNGKRS